MLGFKKIDKIVFKSFIGPLIFTFVISVFIFMMQFLWKYIDDLVGKGLEFKLVLQLLMLFSFKVVPLALPLSILLSATMTMGQYGENNELVACKASGISTLRAMRSLIVFVSLLSVGAFFFSNKVLPYTNLKFMTLLMDIRRHKPALDIKEGVFYKGISGYTLKIGKKSPNNTSIHDIIVYNHSTGYGNDNIILAERGEMTLSADQQYLVFELFHGRQYQDTRKRGQNYEKLFEKNIVEFESYRKVFDLKEFKLNRSSGDLFKGYHEMLDFGQLQVEIDSMYQENRLSADYINDYNRSYIIYSKVLEQVEDTLQQAEMADSTFQALELANVVQTEQPSRHQIQSAISNLNSMMSYVEMQIFNIENTNSYISKFKVELNKKFMLSFVCIILLLIGGSMGAIVRKGGLGMPILISTCFYMIFHVLNMIGDKLAYSQVTSAFIGSWLPILALFPIAIWLTYQAATDSGVFNREIYRRVFRFLQKTTRIFRRSKSPTS